MTNQPLNRSTLNYLYEVAAIPEDVRKAFLEKLQKRKNASSQKNIRLLKYIYYIVENDIVFEYSDVRACRMLQVSRNTLYAHKSRLLKALRKEYFGFDEKKYDTKNLKGNEKLHSLFKKATDMFDCGMRKEAVYIMFKMEKLLMKSKIHERYIYLAQVYERILHYYSIKKKAQRFHHYLNKFEKLYSELKDKKVCSKKEFSLIVSGYHISRARELSLGLNKSIGNAGILPEYKKALRGAINSGDRKKELYVYERLATVYGYLKDYKEAAHYASLGCERSLQYEYNAEYFYFKAFTEHIEFRFGKKDIALCRKEFEKYLNKFLSINNKHTWYIFLLIMHGDFTSAIAADHNEYMRTQKEMIKTNLLISRTGFSLEEVYRYKKAKNNSLLSNIETHNVKNKNIPVITGADSFLLNKWTELANKHYNLFRLDVKFKYYLLLDLMHIEFWKGRNSGYEKPESFLKKVIWLLKSKPGLIDYIDRDIMTCGFKMFDGMNFNTAEYVVNKHYHTLCAIEKKFYTSSFFDVQSNYAKLSFMASIFNRSELWEIVYRIYKWIEKKYPKTAKLMMEEAGEKESVRAA